MQRATIKVYNGDMREWARFLVTQEVAHREFWAISLPDDWPPLA